MINKFFDIVVCLTQKPRIDRRIMFQEEMERNGTTAELFYAIEDADPKVSFCRSQMAMLNWFLETGKETVLCLEDDVQFKGLDKLPKVMEELPKDWKLFYLGANAKPYAEFMPAEPYSKNLRIIRSAFCTHAVAYRRELVQEIVDTYEFKGGQLYDTWLDIHILKKYDCYIPVPMMATQKGVRSDLWGGCVDYSEFWKASDDYLMSVK